MGAHERVGQYAQVARDAAAVAAQAERTGYKPLEAEAWFLALAAARTGYQRLGIVTRAELQEGVAWAAPTGCP